MNLETGSDEDQLPNVLQGGLFDVVAKEPVEEQLWELVNDLEKVNPVRVAARCHDYVSSIDNIEDGFLRGSGGSRRCASAVLASFLELSKIPWILVQLPDQYFLVRTGFSQENWCPPSVAEELQTYYNNRYGQVNRDYRFEQWQNQPCTWFPADTQAQHIGDIRSLKFNGLVELDGDEWSLQDAEAVLTSENLP